jgi:1-phosphofructokinase
MIYTVTFNPSIDYIVTVEGFQTGLTNRTSSELMLPGGKGINVSTVLGNMGLENTALGFIAGFTGEYIRQQVERMGINARFISVDKGMSRINVKLRNIDGTEINGMGPDIPKEKVEQLLGVLDGLSQGDVLVLAGSIPASMPDDIYGTIMERLENKGVMVVVDATSSLLMKVLVHRPFLIKPNHHELGEIYGVTLNGRDEVVPYARRLQEAGARNVLVSMGGRGAVLVAEDGSVYEADAPSGELVNSVGSGDSMVAGFVAGWLRSGDYSEAFRYGVGAGSASAFSRYLATGEEVERTAADVVVRNGGGI